MKKTDRLFYLNELKSEECQCGRSKRVRTTFCYMCWSKLPKHIQRALYKPIGRGYEEAREEAAAHLAD